MMNSLAAKKTLLRLLAFIGGGTVIYLAGLFVLHLLRNQSPDQQSEFISPDRSNRIIITEQFAGFLGSACIKQVYVLRMQERFDRNDERNQVFVGGCDGLIAVDWNGSRVEGDIVLAAAIKNVNAMTLKSNGADGNVQVTWAAH